MLRVFDVFFFNKEDFWFGEVILVWNVLLFMIWFFYEEGMIVKWCFFNKIVIVFVKG